MNKSCLFAGMLILASTAVTMADGPREPRQNATDVFSGKVVAVYRNKGRVLDECVVEIAVDMVVKGDAAKPGVTVYTFCRVNPPGANVEPGQRGHLPHYVPICKIPRPGANVKPGQTGHSMVPEPGQSVRVFINHVNGKNEGVYPDWVDVLEEPPAEALAERSDAADSP